MNPAPALLVEVTRGKTVESVHFGSAAIADRNGLRWSIGDIESPVFPRSAVKPLQALPLIETGAADRLGLGHVEIALACASHSGQPRHVAAVAQWLSNMQLDVGVLACGSHWPLSAEATRDLAARGEAPTALHNNCSGKHTGFVATALCCGESLERYVDANHPTQRRWREVLNEFAAMDLSAAPIGTDGCSIPTIALPLSALARAYASFADPRGFAPTRQRAVSIIRQAMAAEPFLIAGSDRLCTQVIQRSSGAVLVKVGAEGVYCAAIPEVGIGIALKIADGAARAAEVAIVTLVRFALGANHPVAQTLADLCEQSVQTRSGARAGVIRAVNFMEARTSTP